VRWMFPRSASVSPATTSASQSRALRSCGGRAGLRAARHPVDRRLISETEPALHRSGLGRPALLRIHRPIHRSSRVTSGGVAPATGRGRSRPVIHAAETRDRK
jgi:hypothetical protein